MKFLSLFSGIGALEVGLERAGMTCIGQVEWEPYAQTILRKHWPDVPKFTDVRNVGAHCFFQEVEDMAGRLKKLTIDQVADSVRRYDEGESLAKIAVRFGVSRNAMHDLLKRRTDMRPQRRFGAENHFYRGGSKADGYAHDIVEQALEDGVLARPSVCSICAGPGNTYVDGRSPIQAHHDDYNHPLDVRWLCQACHHQWHRQNTPKEVHSKEVTPIDLIAGGFP